MKKIILMLAVILMFTACSNNVEKTSNKSDASIAESTVVSSALLSDEDVLVDLEGVMVKKEYMDNFRQTKTIKDADNNALMLTLRENDGKYEVCFGDAHQGLAYGDITGIEYENGSYIIGISSGDDYKAELTYTPGKQEVVFESDSTMPGFETNGEAIVYERFASLGDYEYQLTKILFENSEDVFCDGYRVLSVKEGVYDEFKIWIDLAGVGASGVNLDECDGALEMIRDNGESDITCRYSYSEGKVTVVDTNGNIIGVY